MLKALMIAAIALVGSAAVAENQVTKAAGSAKSIYDFTVKDIDGKDVALSKYKGDVILIVNVASL